MHCFTGRLSPLLPALGLAVALAGCGSSRGQAPRTFSWPPRVFRPSVTTTQSAGPAAAKSKRPRPVVGTNGPASPIERALTAQGFRFGTDGSTRSLYAYMREVHDIVPAGKARAGDVLFFDREGNGEGCGNHAGLVESVDADGRITFREWRDGQTLVSHVTPRSPQRRRDANGRVLNSFLRSKRQNDPAHTRYFAGEMLCAVARPDR